MASIRQIGEWTWPDVFTDPDFDYGEPTLATRCSACADGHEGWGLVKAGAPLPALFGEGMVKVLEVLGVSGTPESLWDYGEELEAEIAATCPPSTEKECSASQSPEV